jgi:hypothetical protein
MKSSKGGLRLPSSWTNRVSERGCEDQVVNYKAIEFNGLALRGGAVLGRHTLSAEEAPSECPKSDLESSPR